MQHQNQQHQQHQVCYTKSSSFDSVEQEYELSSLFILTREKYEKMLTNLKQQIESKATVNTFKDLQKYSYYQTKFKNDIIKRTGYYTKSDFILNINNTNDETTNQLENDLQSTTTRSTKLFSYYKYIIQKTNFFYITNDFNFESCPTIIKKSFAIECRDLNEIFKRMDDNTKDNKDAKMDPINTIHVTYETIKIYGVRYSIGQQIDTWNGDACYYFQIEQEIDNVQYHDEDCIYNFLSKWDFNFYNFITHRDEIILETVPLIEPKINFEFAPIVKYQNYIQESRYKKQKVDGIRIVAIWDKCKWIFRSNNRCLFADIEETFKTKVPQFVNHYVCLFEYIQDYKELILTDIFYCRNSPSYRNNLHHEYNSVLKPKIPLIPINLYDSLKLVNYARLRYKFKTNLEWDVNCESIPKDGWLVIKNKDTYIKVKQYHTIELYYNNKRFYSLTEEFLPDVLGFYPTEKIDSKFNDNILEFEVVPPSHLKFLRRRTDKKIPDRWNKIYTILEISLWNWTSSN